MKVTELLLKKDVPKLGKRGSIVKVKSGYARNYLIPRGIGVSASKENLRLLEIEKKRLLQLEEERKEELARVAKQLEVATCSIETKANDEGHLFGSVTYSMIAEGFNELGFDVDSDSIALEDAEYPIKEIGIYTIEIQLHPEIKTKSKVWVVNEQETSE